MAVFLLLVTWIVQGEAPNSYQVPFNSRERCEAAKSQLTVDAQNMLRQRTNDIRRTAQEQRLDQQDVDALMENELLRRPSVSAVCIEK